MPFGSVGPLGLHHRDYGAFNHPPPAKGSFRTGSIRPTGLHHADGGFELSPTAEPVGAQSNAEAGNVSALVDNLVRQELAPHGLVVKKRFFAVKSVGEVSVTITGSEVRAQGEELEGVNATIYIDGAVSNLSAGLLFQDKITGRIRRKEFFGTVEIFGELYFAFDRKTFEMLKRIKERLEEKHKKPPKPVVLRLTDEIRELLEKHRG